MKKLLAATVALSGILFGGCGSGKIVPPPPSGQFSNASLTGQYAFSMTGLNPNSAYVAQIGSFSADGNGHITGGLEDILNLNTGKPASVVSISGGTYAVQSNGQVSMTLNAADGAELQLSIVLQSNSAGILIETDLNATASGTFNLQSSNDFSNASLGHVYAFDVAGVSFSSTSAAPIAIVGQTVLDGSGTITGGVVDINDGNAAGPSGATTVSSGTYALDTNGNGTSYGRGMMSFNGRTFAFYVVDATHLKLLEEDTLGGDEGDAVQQAASVTTQNSQFNGSFVYLIGGGVSVRGSQGPVVRVARFTADGNGGLGAISLDDNNDGGYTHISQGGNISAATYSIDTANAGSGRGTFTFKDSGSGTFSAVFYMISATQAVVLETSKGIIGNGPMYAQTGGPFTLSGSAGTYVTLWTGEQLGYQTAVPFEETYVGRYTLSNANSSNISGVIDYAELGVSAKFTYSNVGLGGTLMINKDGTANNHYQFAIGGSAAATVNFQAYFANPNTLLMICSDSTRTAAGIINPQQ